ncbi:MAG: low temperature requirement protein A, partial [Actinomycetota bacterium]|nr:low temperature requirement protein A [Actinomycetota bacterium]
LLEHDISFGTAAQVVLIFVVLFWMNSGYVWLTNQVPPNGATRRLLLFGGMGAFLICALSVPDAFGDTGVTFGVGYLLVVVVHAGLYAETHGTAVLRFVPLNVVGALAVIVAGFVEGPAAYALWLVPIVFQYLTSIFVMRSVNEERRAGFDVHPEHFVERHGLLLIVAFGESVVAIGIGIGDTALDLGTLGAALLGLALASALWWAYFDEDANRAEAALLAASVNDRLRMSLNAYFYAYIPMLLGVVMVAAGVALAIEDVGGAVEFGPALLLGAGVALYLAGNVAFRAALGIRQVAYRISVAAVALVSPVLGLFVAVLAQLISLLVLLAAMLVLEARRRSRLASAG